MIFTCIAHAMFLMELENGMRIVTDPVGEDSGFPVTPVRADLALVSHQHHDHNALGSVTGAKVIDAAGVYCPDMDVRVTAVKSFHDDAQGAKRGDNLLFLIEAEGLRVAHLGDLGHLPTQEQIAALAPVDVLMVPCGGFYTIDAAQAKETARLLGAKVILPMHYRTAANADWPIAPVEDFLALYGGMAERLSLLRVCRGDMDCQPALAVLEPASLK